MLTKEQDALLEKVHKHNFDTCEKTLWIEEKWDIQTGKSWILCHIVMELVSEGKLKKVAIVSPTDKIARNLQDFAKENSHVESFGTNTVTFTNEGNVWVVKSFNALRSGSFDGVFVYEVSDEKWNDGLSILKTLSELKVPVLKVMIRLTRDQDLIVKRQREWEKLWERRLVGTCQVIEDERNK